MKKLLSKLNVFIDDKPGPSTGTGIQFSEQPRANPLPPADPRCPYCSVKMTPLPKRSGKCSSCGKRVLVKAHSPGQRKRLVTEAEAVAIDRELELSRDLAAYDITKRERRELEADLAKRFGCPPSGPDLLWAASNLRLTQAAKRKDFWAISRIYDLQAHQLYREGKDHVPTLIEARRWELKAIEQNGITTRVRISVNGDSCMQCQKLKGRQYKIEEALRKAPLPVRECSHHYGNTPESNTDRGFCQCVYRPMY